MRNSIRLLIPLLFSASGFFAAAAEPNPADTFRFTGKVMTAGKQPVAGAVAELYQYGPPFESHAMAAEMELRQRVTADSNGIFQARLPRAQSLAVVRQPGYAPSWVTVFNIPGDIDEQIILTTPTNLVGTVIDEVDKPVSGAEVWASFAILEVAQTPGGRGYWLPPKIARQMFSTKTAADGRFTMDGFPTNGMAHFAARAPGKVFREPQNQSFGPDTAYRPGQKDIKVQVEPAGSLEGRVTIGDTGEPLGGVKVLVQREQGGVSSPDPVRSNPDGTFRFSELAAGAYRLHAVFGTGTLSEWVIENVPVSIEGGQTTRNAKLTATRGGVLEVSVFDDQHQPLGGATVNAFREWQGSGAISSEDGKAVLRLGAGRYQLSASKDGLRAENTGATVEVGTTNRVEIQFKPRPKIAGTLRDPAGKPVPGVKLTIFPNWNAPPEAKSDGEGRFELFWEPHNYGMNSSFSLIARDLDRNLALAYDIDESTRTLDLQLQPGLIFTGRIETTDGRALTNGSVSVTLWAGNMGSTFGEPSSTDSAGNFKVICMPSARRYSLNASAPGYGSSYKSVEEEADTNTVQVPTFMLKLADRDFGGQVLDDQEKPAAGANVSIQGEGQPSIQLVTDSSGRFTAKVCEGIVRIYANGRNSYCNSSAEAGDTNVVLQLHSYSIGEREQPRRAALKGRALPSLAPLGLPSSTPDGPLLLCLFDSEQRPSRRFVRSLADQHDSIRKKNVTVLAIQAVVIPADSLQAWKDGAAVPFPVGQVSDKTPAVKWVTDLDSLPWLILTDAKHNVVEEGFSLDEIDAKLDMLPK